jgi:SUMO ligase MMS21 Smc5/6 complex component
MYRNIDDDARLLSMAKRYWSDDQLTKEQLQWVLKSEGYSEREIDNAIGDYYAVHLRSDIMLHHFIAPVVLVIIMIVLILKVYSLLK